MPGNCAEAMQCVTRSEPLSIGAFDRAARQTKIKADRPGQPRQTVGYADVRKQADLGLGHRPFVIFAGYAMRIVRR